MGCMTSGDGAAAIVREAQADFLRRSELTWTVAVDTGLLARYPQHEVVVALIGRPHEGMVRAASRDRPVRGPGPPKVLTPGPGRRRDEC